MKENEKKEKIEKEDMKKAFPEVKITDENKSDTQEYPEAEEQKTPSNVENPNIEGLDLNSPSHNKLLIPEIKGTHDTHVFTTMKQTSVAISITVPTDHNSQVQTLEGKSFEQEENEKVDQLQKLDKQLADAPGMQIEKPKNELKDIFKSFAYKKSTDLINSDKEKQKESEINENFKATPRFPDISKTYRNSDEDKSKSMNKFSNNTKNGLIMCDFSNLSQNMLEFVCPYIYNDKLDKSEKVKYPYLNIGFIRLNWLQDTTGFTKIVLPKCKNCNWKISKFATLKQKEKIINSWVCPNCNSLNNAENVKIPEFSTTLEIVGKIPDTMKKRKILICVDTSPSMNRTIMIKNGEKQEPLIKIPSNNRKSKINVSYTMQVKESILKLLEKLYHENPNVIVGLILFSNQLTIYGDCVSQILSNTIKDSDFYSWDRESNIFSDKNKLSKVVANNYKNCIEIPLSKSYPMLIKTIESIEISLYSATALGPCLVAANELMKNSETGSQILVFTDGGANHGCGALTDTEEKDIEFYNVMADEFYKNHLSVSFYTFGEFDCSLSTTNYITEKTQGLLRRYAIPIDPPNIELPVYIDNIKDIRVELQPSNSLILLPINDIVTIVNTNMVHLHERTYILNTSTFFFEYFINPNTQANLTDYYLQIQITYSYCNLILLRTITEKLQSKDSALQPEFNQFDILLKYVAKLAMLALQNPSRSIVKEAVIDKIDKIIEFISSEKNSKTNGAIIDIRNKILKHKKAVKTGKKDDKYMSRRSEDLTCELY